MSEGVRYLIVTGAVWAVLILLVIVAVAGLLYRQPRAGHVRRALQPPEKRDDTPLARARHDQPELPATSDRSGGHDNEDYRPYTAAPETRKLQRAPADGPDGADAGPEEDTPLPSWPNVEAAEIAVEALSADESGEGEI
jgi:hypothetical protein